MPYYPQLVCALRNFTRRRALEPGKASGASSSEAAEGSGGPPASHVKMRRPTGEQCFQSKPELVTMGSLLGLRKTRPQTPSGRRCVLPHHT